MHGWSFPEIAIAILGCIGALKALTTLGLPELREALGEVFDFVDWLRRRWNRMM